MNLRSLEYFLVVTEEMNFTRAAERLFITQQALSSHIQRLEAEYDAELFHRKPVLSLTQKGEELRYWAQQILSAEKALRANLHDISINCRGRIRIGIARLRANAMMPDIMERYRKAYPNVTIELVDGSTDVLQGLLLENKVDMYVGVNVETGMNEVQVPLVEEEIWGCSSQSFFRAQFSEESEMQHFLNNERDIRTLHGLPLLVTQPSNRIRRQLDKYYLDGSVRPYIYFESNSQLLLYELARRNMGLAVISPIALFDRQQELDGMISFPICHSLQKNAMSLVYRRDDPMPQFARDFIAVTEEVARLYVKSLKLLTANVTQYSRQFDWVKEKHRIIETKPLPVLTEDRPCTRNCPRHGNCVACVKHHRAKGVPGCCWNRAMDDMVNRNIEIPEWDAYEQSILRRVADEVKIGIRGGTVDMTAFKSFD